MEALGAEEEGLEEAVVEAAGVVCRGGEGVLLLLSKKLGLGVFGLIWSSSWANIYFSH